jgi:hypothetical protein
MKWSDPSLIAGDNLDEDLFLFVRNKLRGVRFASLEELAHERITVHLPEGSEWVLDRERRWR